jgi:hypothetical protein
LADGIIIGKDAPLEYTAVKVHEATESGIITVQKLEPVREDESGNL